MCNAGKHKNKLWNNQVSHWRVNISNTSMQWTMAFERSTTDLNRTRIENTGSMTGCWQCWFPPKQSNIDWNLDRPLKSQIFYKSSTDPINTYFNENVTWRFIYELIIYTKTLYIIGPGYDVKLIRCCPQYDVKLMWHHRGNDIVSVAAICVAAICTEQLIFLFGHTRLAV